MADYATSRKLRVDRGCASGIKSEIVAGVVESSFAIHLVIMHEESSSDIDLLSCTIFIKFGSGDVAAPRYRCKGVSL